MAMREVALDGPRFNPGGSAYLEAHTSIYVPIRSFAQSLELSDSEAPGVLHDVMVGLLREELVGGTWAHGPVEDLNAGRWSPKFDEPGLVASASFAGIKLFHFAHGRRDADEHDFISPDLEVEELEAVTPFAVTRVDVAGAKTGVPSEPPTEGNPGSR